MKSVFVTGGSGFVGSALIKRLKAQNIKVVALSRSKAGAALLESFDAEVCFGDLTQTEVMAKGMLGCDAVFHVAGHLSEWDPYEVFETANVLGTKNALAAAHNAGVPKFIAVGASAVVMGQPGSMQNVSEANPLQSPSWAPYITTKAEAERLTIAANGSRMSTMVVRPPLIWGAGMPMLDEMVAAAKAGRFAIPDGGKQLMSTCHVDNVVECLLLAAENGRGGEVYNVADEDVSTLQTVLSDLLATRGIPPIKRSVPFYVAWRLAALMEMTWHILGLKSKPPVTRQTLRMIGQDFTLDITKAKRELNYIPIIGRQKGLLGMRT